MIISCNVVFYEDLLPSISFLMPLFTFDDLTYQIILLFLYNNRVNNESLSINSMVQKESIYDLIDHVLHTL